VIDDDDEMPPVIGEKYRDLLFAITGQPDKELIDMSKTKVRIKAAAAIGVPQTLAEVNRDIAAIGIAQRERDRIRADMNDALAAQREMWEAQARPYADQIKELTSGVQLYCEANRSNLTQNGKVKTAKLASGEVSWRTRPPSVTVRGAELVIEALKTLGLARFVRIKEEVNKEAILAEPEVAQQVRGVTISQGEDFVVKPWDTELEQVA
jgi:phage host-nuclease inhibitor protein Gam